MKLLNSFRDEFREDRLRNAPSPKCMMCNKWSLQIAIWHMTRHLWTFQGPECIQFYHLKLIKVFAWWFLHNLIQIQLMLLWNVARKSIKIFISGTSKFVYDIVTCDEIGFVSMNLKQNNKRLFGCFKMNKFWQKMYSKYLYENIVYLFIYY